MPYIGQVTVGEAWADLKTQVTPNLMDGTDYVLVNNATHSIEIRELAETVVTDPPADDAQGIPIEAGEKWILTPESGVPAWARSLSNTGSANVVIAT